MFCKHCGKEVSDEAIICPSCGCEVKQTVKMEKTNTAKTLAIIGFIFSFLFGLVGLNYLYYCTKQIQNARR